MDRACEKLYLEICFVIPSSRLDPAIFGFPEFISALALLVIVYTVTDIRYRFRLAVAPAPLFQLTYVLIGIIGFGTLMTEIWITERWLVPLSLLTQSMWQGMFGAFFAFGRNDVAILCLHQPSDIQRKKLPKVCPGAIQANLKRVGHRIARYCE